MTYNVFGGTICLTQSINLSSKWKLLSSLTSKGIKFLKEDRFGVV